MTDVLALLQAAAQAAADTAGGYGHFPGIGARGAVWIAAEVHLMFAAFVLGGLWYGPLFGAAWMRETMIARAPR